jgi:hypothetical protein
VLSRLRGPACVARHHPRVPLIVVAAAILGALGGLLPTGFLGRDVGAGVGGGASWGLWTLTVCAPGLAAALAGAIAGSRYEPGLDRDLFLSGQPARRSAASDACVAIVACLLLTLPAAVAGGLVGSGDALAQGTPLLTGLSWSAAAWSLAALAWSAGLGTCCTLLSRSALLGTVLPACALLLVVAFVRIAPGADVPATIVAWSPLAPVGLLTESLFEGTGSLPVVRAGVVAACWLLVLVLASLRVTRRRLPA